MPEGWKPPEIILPPGATRNPDGTITFPEGYQIPTSELLDPDNLPEGTELYSVDPTEEGNWYATQYRREYRTLVPKSTFVANDGEGRYGSIQYSFIGSLVEDASGALGLVGSAGAGHVGGATACAIANSAGTGVPALTTTAIVPAGTAAVGPVGGGTAVGAGSISVASVGTAGGVFLGGVLITEGGFQLASKFWSGTPMTNSEMNDLKYMYYEVVRNSLDTYINDPTMANYSSYQVLLDNWNIVNDPNYIDWGGGVLGVEGESMYDNRTNYLGHDKEYEALLLARKDLFPPEELIPGTPEYIAFFKPQETQMQRAERLYNEHMANGNADDSYKKLEAALLERVKNNETVVDVYADYADLINNATTDDDLISNYIYRKFKIDYINAQMDKLETDESGLKFTDYDRDQILYHSSLDDQLYMASGDIEFAARTQVLKDKHDDEKFVAVTGGGILTKAQVGQKRIVNGMSADEFFDANYERYTDAALEQMGRELLAKQEGYLDYNAWVEKNGLGWMKDDVTDFSRSLTDYEAWLKGFEKGLINWDGLDQTADPRKNGNNVYFSTLSDLMKEMLKGPEGLFKKDVQDLSASVKAYLNEDDYYIEK